jgi:hypothetical protein
MLMVKNIWVNFSRICKMGKEYSTLPQEIVMRVCTKMELEKVMALTSMKMEIFMKVSLKVGLLKGKV